MIKTILLFSFAFCIFDYNGIIGSGQSLAVGVNSGNDYTGTKTQPFNNLKISLGSKESSWPLDSGDSEFSLVPLTEPLRTIGYRNHYPQNLFGETPHGAMANQITSLSSSIITVHTEVGESGQGIEMLKKGATDNGDSGRAYNATLFEVKALVNLAKKAGKTYGVNGFILTHGEHDAGLPTYQSEVAQLYRDYVKDISAITGQSERPVFLVSQQHSNTGSNIDLSTLAEWHVEEDEPGGIICSGPKYQFQYSDDGIHMTSKGYQALGEKYGEIYNEVIVKGNRNWRSLEPTSAHRVDDHTVNVTFHVPNPPMQWDSSFPNPSAKSQWSRGRGFELSVDNTALDISSAEISGSSVLVISSQTLPTSNLKVGYAATPQSKRSGGTVRWGLLKDSDSTMGYHTRAAMPNWAIAFEMKVE